MPAGLLCAESLLGCVLHTILLKPASCAQLQQLFGFCGTVKDCRFVGIARTYAFIEFENEEVRSTDWQPHTTSTVRLRPSIDREQHQGIDAHALAICSPHLRLRGGGLARATVAAATTCRLRDTRGAVPSCPLCLLVAPVRAR